MAHTAANHWDAGVVAGRHAAPFPPDLCRFTTNHIEAKWSALKRRVRRKCGRAIPRARDWNLYIMGFQRVTWFAGPYAPLLLDGMRRANAETRAEAREIDARGARALLMVNAIDLTCDEDV